jgi:hypothetical protein
LKCRIPFPAYSDAHYPLTIVNYKNPFWKIDLQVSNVSKCN